MNDAHAPTPPPAVPPSRPPVPSPTAPPAAPPTPPPITAGTDTRRRWEHPAAFGAVVFAGSTVAAGLLGYGAGWVLASQASGSCSPADAWCELGAAIWGLMAGVVIGVATYLTVGITLIRRFRPRGERALPTIIHVLLPVATGITVAVLALALDAMRSVV